MERDAEESQAANAAKRRRLQLNGLMPRLVLI